jgi:peptidoglycan/LPS O-acetylase OafA/YrhL
MMPANPPSWSLFFEMVANIGYAISVPFLRTSALVATCAVAMAGLVLYGVTWGSIEYCPTATTALLAGALRVSFSFPAGVLVYRYWNGGNKAPRVAAWAICALLVAIFLAPGGGPKHRYILDLAVIALILPPLVWIGASARETGKLWRLSGELSYPLYAIHYIPLVAACVVISGATESLALRAAGLAAVVAALCGAALMASRAERAMRQALEPKGAPLVKRLVEFGAHNRAHPTTPLARLFRANPPKPLVPCQICGAPATPGGVMGNVCQSCGAW